MNKKNNNKGFTLVELIVVLVILAILAAILVPALLGYIDRAKGQQIVLNARSAYTAAQAELTSLYAKDNGKTDKSKNPGHIDNLNKDRLLTTADVTCDQLKIGCKETYDASTTDKAKLHSMYTVDSVIYTEGSTTVYLYKGEWLADTEISAEDKAEVEGKATITVK